MVRWDGAMSRRMDIRSHNVPAVEEFRKALAAADKAAAANIRSSYCFLYLSKRLDG
jgi:hypothetical protein